LQFLTNILDQVKYNEQTFRPHNRTREALALCLEPPVSLNSIAETLIPGFASKKRLKQKWAAIETVINSEKITKFRSKLQEPKSNLTLALQLSPV
jgi:hypothetical protein